MIVKIRIVAVILFLFICTFSAAKDISFEFSKETNEDNEVEKAYGYMYVKIMNNKADNCVYIHVTSPVNQIVEYKGSTTTIYYPEEKKAFIYESGGSVGRINAVEPAAKNLNLKNSGLLMIKNDKTADGTREVWVMKNIAASPIKEILVGRTKKGAVSLLEIKDKSGKILSRMKYSDFRMINGTEMPLYIENYITGSSEIMKLSNPDERSPLPDLIRNFAVPKDAEIDRIRY